MAIALSLIISMENMMTHNKQAVGSNFDLQKMHIARDKTFEAVHVIAQQITVGMSEADARELAKDILVEMGMDRIWQITSI